MGKHKPSPTAALQGKKLIPFGWYGGKFSHLDWLLPLLPERRRYCEPFAGSGSVLLNRAPAQVETYNDLDGEVVNFFRVLRSKKEKLIEAVSLTPFSREEFALACELQSGLSAFERARRFYIRARQVRTGLAQRASLGRWANCKNTSRRGMSGVVSRWLGGLESLAEISERLLRVQIENRPAVEVIKLYDSPDTLFYCDPPYIHETRGDVKAYSNEMNDQDHEELARILNSVQGLVAVSNYDCDFMNRLYPSKKWIKTTGPKKTIHSTKDKRAESLWTNYNPEKTMRVEKIKKSSYLDNYIFITAESVKDAVLEIAKKSRSLTGVEIAVLDCIGFIRHFLYLFYRIRMNFLNEYQKLVLNEPDSAVSQELKEAFIVLRKACERE